MIEDLTKKKLIKYGFSLDTVERLETWKNYSAIHHANEDTFYACNSENKIYSGIDALRKEYFRNENQIGFPEKCYPLMLEYYDITFSKFLKEYSEIKKRNSSNVDEKQAELDFIKNSIKIVTDRINEYDETLQKKNLPTILANEIYNKTSEIKRYLEWLKNKKVGYQTFDELFEDAITYKSIVEPKTAFQKEASRAYHNFSFNIWLQGNKGWDGSREQYIELLTRENWKEYILYEKEKRNKLRAKFEAETVSWQTDSKTELEQKINYYYDTNPCITFKQLSNTVKTVCEFVRPIYPSVDPLKYFAYFFKSIDFDKIDADPSKEEMLKYCNAIYYGLEQLLRHDIEAAIAIYQSNISNLTSEQIRETQIKLTATIGNLKIQTRTLKKGVSFTQRFNIFYKAIQGNDGISYINYLQFIGYFTETISSYLLSSFEIINQTFKEISPLLSNNTMQIDPALRRKNIIDFLYEDLKKRCAAYLAELNNPLATELDYIDKEISLLNVAISELTERNNIQHHGGASDLEYKKINLLAQLKIAEQLKAELFPQLTEIKSEQPTPDIKPIFKPEPVETKAEQPTPEISRTKQFISEQLEAIDINEGWKYAFKNETDYNIFLELLTNHFEYKSYTLPQSVVKLKKDCKTRFAKILRPIHKELSENSLKSDKEFLNLIRVLNHFEKLSDTEIYQAITR